jgi:hypothetical protein
VFVPNPTSYPRWLALGKRLVGVRRLTGLAAALLAVASFPLHNGPKTPLLLLDPGLSGSISDAGVATLSIDLATVDTAIDIRNQRMRDIVFQVAQFPKAEVSVTVDVEAMKAMKAGIGSTGSYPVSVSLHGVKAEMTADLQVIKLDATTLQVQLARPLIVAADKFGLAAGVEELRTVANLPSITPNVVVDFTLVYRE